MKALVILIAFSALVGCPPSAPCGYFPGTTTPAPCPSDAGRIDAAGLRTYVCPISDAGPAWTCLDNGEAGTCASYGCVPQ